MSATAAILDDLVAVYGDGGLCPTRAQWAQLLGHPSPGPIVVVNFFRVREQADATLTGGEPLTGFQSLLEYSEVSRRKVDEVGGRFLSTALFDTVLMGDDRDWSLVAIAEYPDRKAFVRLFQDREYQQAHRFRLAAIEAQRVLVANRL